MSARSAPRRRQGGRKGGTSMRLGMTLLGIWLILQGALPLLQLSLPFDAGALMNLLALVAGIFLVTGR